VVAKKKLDSLRDWLKGCDTPCNGTPRVVLLVGPPGSGKSAALRLVAAEAGRGVHEWCAPTPTLWSEFKHANAPGVAYSSKVDDFAAFVTRARASPREQRRRSRRQR
jgi:cell cycle checkpoint protein